MPNMWNQREGQARNFILASMLWDIFWLFCKRVSMCLALIQSRARFQFWRSVFRGGLLLIFWCMHLCKFCSFCSTESSIWAYPSLSSFDMEGGVLFVIMSARKVYELADSFLQGAIPDTLPWQCGTSASGGGFGFPSQPGYCIAFFFFFLSLSCQGTRLSTH